MAQPVTESNIIIPFGSSDQESHQNFSPVSIKIDNGLHDVVRWINLDNVTNTLVGDPPISSGPILPNQTWALTFYIPGEYHYSSKEHPWMSGTISVWVGRPSYSSVPENITTITLTPGQVMGPIIVKSINHDNVTGIYFPGFDNYAHTFSLQVGQNFTTWWCQGVFVTLEKISDKNATFFVKNTWKSCPICLSSNTLIDTPHGNHDVKELKVGMPVWTLDKSGHKESAIIVKTAKKMVPANSAMIQITLDDGRKLLASPAHPTTDGRLLGEISVGDILDGSPVKRVELLSYNENYTYDILPSGPTGFYWANGILVGSTLN
ncbi:MAG: hypothetical protein E6K98_04925 [Thaumarchaeota archaeon]|nr:MAG: hypothetical protein E6K98_04925 [Nitrososphaerota archaeon]